MRLLTADHVLPVSSPPIEDGGVLVSEGRILAVGSAADLRQDHPDVPEDRFAGSAILPGFVNCHSHLELTVLRGLLDDLDHDFASWLIRLTQLRAETLSDEDIADSALAGALEGLKAGVTCFGDIGRWGLAGFEALKSTGLRGVLFQETEFSPENATAESDLAALLEKIGTLREAETEKVKVGISPHSPYTVSPALFERLAEASREKGLKVTIHAAESDAEQELLTGRGGFFAKIFEQYGVRWTPPGKRSIEYLSSAGILDTTPLLAHCTKADENEIRLIAESGSKIAHCPKSNAKFGHGVAPLSRFLVSGIEVGLGTDSMVSNNLCDMLEEARFAALAARIASASDRFIQPSEALKLATLGGAEALGLAGETGSLEPGKAADLIAVSLREVSRLPVNDVESALVFASGAGDVEMTMVAGEVLYRDGECPGADADRLRARMNEIGSRLKEAL
ncbi:MAG: amidohydrolase family protein [Acidobacteriota bacterium]|nr:MAG: amidohydrolase family protein [Acidobacteriota bacterium]